MDLKELKEMLAQIESEKQAKLEEDKKADELLNTLVNKVADVVKAAKEEKPVTPPAGESPKNGEEPKEEKVAKFFKALVRGDEKTVMEYQGKALSDTDAAGGYLVPEEFQADIIDWALDKPVVRRFATVWPMKGKQMNIPRLAADVAVYWGSENTSISTTSADFGEVSLTPHKLNAIIYLSEELFEDSAVALVPYLTGRFAMAIYREEDSKFINGSGTGQPKGILAETLASVDASTNGTVDHLIDAYWRLPQSHRDSAVWVMDNLTLSKVSALKDTNGQYLLVRPTDGQLPTLMGRPVLEQNDMGKTVLFGDLRFYYIGDRRQITVKTTTEGAGTFEKDQVAIKVTERVDGETALTRAFRKIANFR